MHEMALAENILNLALYEAEKQGCDVLLSVQVEYGILAGIMPDALELCFNSLAGQAGQGNVKLKLTCVPLKLRCPFCNAEFGGSSRDAIWQPCPECGEEFGHTVIQGKELILARIEARRSLS